MKVKQMAASDFFPQRPEIHPMIYAYEEDNPKYKGLLKVGYTAVGVKKRVAQQYPIKRPDGSAPYRIVVMESAMYPDGTAFTDREVHSALKKRGIFCVGGEWFRCTPEDVKAAVIAVRSRTENAENRTRTFKMRPEQEAAVEQTIEYYESERKTRPNRAPKFLWNAKMRFGKTFAAYELAKRMKLKRILILTFKPAAQSAWREDLLTHIDFEGWQFICRPSGAGELSMDMQYEKADKNKPIVCFGSFQNLLGVNKQTGGIKAENEWIHTMNWDLVIFDEYHFGAWRANAKKLFEQEDEDEYDAFDAEKYQMEEAGDAYNETFLPITTSYYLFLSGTPFRALHCGEFLEDQIFSWTYSDEQREKEKHRNDPESPYAALPRMVLMAYKVPAEVEEIALKGEFNEFNLNTFFAAQGNGGNAEFVHKEYVQKWLDFIRGAYFPFSEDALKLGKNKRPVLPYSDVRLLDVLIHTIWFLPNVASCYAMRNLLAERQNTFYHGYNVVVCAGPEVGNGEQALEPVKKAMGEDPLNTKTITLTCGKLVTGVTVRQWTGIFMLRDLSSPETYFQAAFRVQSPWTLPDDTGREKIIKNECYVFDFAINRALHEISEYSCQLDLEESNPEKKVAEFISFLPVLAYDGNSMMPVDAEDILSFAATGTSTTLLARRWESALLVNVDNETLNRILNNPKAMEALNKIEDFRNMNLSNDIEMIINKSEAVKNVRKEKEKIVPKEQEALTDEEKEYKSKRREIQKKLIKFAARIPIFMYLTDFRENTLHDVITKLEPNLFKKVTGLEVGDFELLVSLNVFNSRLMNESVYMFKHYEDASLSYTGINRHGNEKVGLYDTVLSREDYDELAKQQKATETAPPADDRDIPDYDYFAGDADRTEVEKTQKPINEPIAVSAKKSSAKIPLKSGSTESKIGDVNLELGSAVYHKKFGKGEVVQLTKTRAVVRFSEGEKIFIIPDAIKQGFVKVMK